MHDRICETQPRREPSLFGARSTHCPTPATPLWNMHPRVFLEITRTGDILCPYCGTHYVFKGELPTGH